MLPVPQPMKKIIACALMVLLGTSTLALDGTTPSGVDKKNTGHHHLFIDLPALGKGAEGASELDYNIPADAKHVHFGKGQTEKWLTLSPGKHTLQLVLSNMGHVPHNRPVASQVITITVN